MSFLLVITLFLFAVQPAAGSLPSSNDNDIREAVFRYLMNKYPAADAYCLSTGIAGRGGYIDPDPELLARFRGKPIVKKASECIGNSTGPFLIEPRSVLLTVEKITSLSQTSATVEVQYFRNLQDSGGGSSKVSRQENGQWVVIDFKSLHISRVPDKDQTFHPKPGG
jgi:hypothetical protein